MMRLSFDASTYSHQPGPDVSVASSKRLGTERQARELLALDDVVDLEELRWARKHYPSLGQHRHEALTKGL
jgi:hypothetical protein